jgi:glycine C-acetyltransferase
MKKCCKQLCFHHFQIKAKFASAVRGFLSKNRSTKNSKPILSNAPERVETLRQNARYFRDQLTAIGFKPLPGETPIIPVIVGETAAAIQMSQLLLEEGVFVTGFGYPVVPQGTARVRCQVSAVHTRDDLDQALAAFRKVGARLGLI